MQVYKIPLTTRFRNLDTREGVVWRGDAGWAEFSPFWDYDDATAVSWWRAAAEAANDGWPAPLRDSVAVNATVPAVSAEQARQIILRSNGCTTVKVKVAQAGQSLAQAEARLEAARDALGPAGSIRIDVNGAWSLEQALHDLPKLDRAAGGLQYVEQPCATVAELAELRRRTNVPIAADESIRLASDPYQVVKQDAADVLVLKVQPLGGVRACLELVADLNLPVVVSSALETEVGIAAGLALAAALPVEPLASGVATASLLSKQLTAAGFPVESGRIKVSTSNLPARVSTELLAEAAADQETSARWLERVARVQALATNQRHHR